MYTHIHISKVISVLKHTLMKKIALKTITTGMNEIIICNEHKVLEFSVLKQCNDALTASEMFV